MRLVISGIGYSSVSSDISDSIPLRNPDGVRIATSSPQEQVPIIGDGRFAQRLVQFRIWPQSSAFMLYFTRYAKEHGLDYGQMGSKGISEHRQASAMATAMQNAGVVGGSGGGSGPGSQSGNMSLGSVGAKGSGMSTV